LRHADLERDRPASCARVLPFSRVEAMVDGLSARLDPGGLLAITNCHYRFVDMAAAAAFETALALPEAVTQNEPLYGSDNRLLTETICSEVVFRKTHPEPRPKKSVSLG
jgi:hypothetical protein